MEITLQLRFVFAGHCDVFLLGHCDVFFITSQHAIYLFVVGTFFDDVRITLYFSTFELRTEISL